MKNFIRIGLPIIVVFGVVFVITLAQRYTTETDNPNNDGPSGPANPNANRKPPLRFATTQAISGYADAAGAKATLKYWNSSVEIGEPSSLEFLCQNPNDQPVNVEVHYASCTCVGTALGVIPQEAWRDYVQMSGLNSGVLFQTSPLLAIATHVKLHQQTKWDTLKGATENAKEIINNKLTIPAADPKHGPQMAFVRLGWTGKSPADTRTISANVFAQLPNQPVASTILEAVTQSVLPFTIYRPDADKGLLYALEANVGDIREGGTATTEVYVVSVTRPYPLYSVSLEGVDPCLQMSEPKPVEGEELARITKYLQADPKTYRGIKSAYKFTITAKERVEQEVEGVKKVYQLDLGFLERRLAVSAATTSGEPATVSMFVRGRVYGELTVTSGAETGRIELGNAFPAEAGVTKDVTITAERPGLDIKLLPDETTPNYLQVTLDPRDDVDGRKRWRVRVTVPKETLFGPLPLNSGIMLQTTDAPPRRIRIPIRGMSVDTGRK